MECLWLEEGRLELREVPRPAPGRDEALIRVRLAAVCGTDLELEKGYYPYTGIPGHEFVGEIVESPPGGPAPGRRVVGEINAPCGECDDCRNGRPNHCAHRTVLGIVGRNGAFARYLTLPGRNVHPVPDDLPDEKAVFCEPVAAAARIPEQVEVGPGLKVAVLGAGRFGQLIARVLERTGCHLKVAAKYQNQRDLLTGAGIDVTGAEEMKDRWADTVVEATGRPQGFAEARRIVRSGGTIVLKSTYKGTLEADFSAVVVDEITIVGSRCGPFPDALAMLAADEVDPTPLVEARYPLKEGLEAFARAKRPGTMKVLVEP